MSSFNPFIVSSPSYYLSFISLSCLGHSQTGKLLLQLSDSFLPGHKEHCCRWDGTRSLPLPGLSWGTREPGCPGDCLHICHQMPWPGWPIRAMTTQWDTLSVWHHLSCQAAGCLTASCLSLLAALLSLSLPPLFCWPCCQLSPHYWKPVSQKPLQRSLLGRLMLQHWGNQHKTLTEGLPEWAWL